MLENLHQSEQRGQPHFVIIIDNAFFKFGNIYRFPTFFNHFASHGDLDSQELVALAILTGPSFEKPGEAGHLRRVGMRHHLGQ